MKIALLCKSDSEGGAAVVTRRLTEALRREGADAKLLVLDKRSDADYIVKVNYPLLKPLAFLAERLQIFFAMRFHRKNLFKTDTAAFGLPLWHHPVVREADVVILNWVNQGMLSLKGVNKLCRAGKRVIWTMHDMWNLTGICHHAMECRRFTGECGDCPYLGKGAGKRDLSRRTWRRKRILYDETDIRFVAVSSWLAREASKSSLLGGRKVEVIPNPFLPAAAVRREREKMTILFAAAGLDNWIKGLDTFREAIGIFKDRYPQAAENCEVCLMGAVKNPEAIEGFSLPTRHIGVVNGDEALARVYSEADVTVNTSFFENLPGTLVEGQAYGAVPVAFDRGGQRDIIDHLSTGYLAEWSDDATLRAGNIAEGIAWAIEKLQHNPHSLRSRMRAKTETSFSYPSVASRYLG